MLTEYASGYPAPYRDATAVFLSIDQPLGKPASSPRLATARRYTVILSSIYRHALQADLSL